MRPWQDLCDWSILARYAGLSQRGAAERLGMGSGSAACRQLAAADRWLEGDADLRPTMTKAELLLVAAKTKEYSCLKSSVK